MQHGGVPELLLGLGYNGTTGRLTVEIVKGSHFRTLSINKAPDTYVKLCLVSSIGQEISRAKTSTRRGQPNPLFKETFVFQVSKYSPINNRISKIGMPIPHLSVGVGGIRWLYAMSAHRKNTADCILINDVKG